MDYRDFERGYELGKTGKPVGYWWLEKSSEDRANCLIEAAGLLQEQSTPRAQNNLVTARLYGNCETLSFGIREGNPSSTAPTNRVALNVVASCVDTLAAKIAKTRPRPAFLTEGGSYSMQQSAKKMDKFWRGVFHDSKVYQVTQRVFVDGCIFDVGALKGFVCPEEKKLKFERVFPGDIFVDEVDGMHGCPRQLLQRMYVPREVLLSRYSEDKAKSEKIREAKGPEEANKRGFGDVVEVWEAWHLRSSEEADDGHHILAIDGCELEYEPWKLSRFPFSFFRFSHRQMGFFGQGLAERLTGIQREINRLLRSISEQLRRKGRGRVFVPMGSKVVPQHLTNAIGDIIQFSGSQPPIVDSANAVAGEEFSQLDRLYQRAYQEAGISELSAGAKKPSGLDAAVAIREFNDVETERFALVGRAWEELHLDLTELGIELLDEYGPRSYKVKVPGYRTVEFIDYKDIEATEEKFLIQIFPVSSLPSTPSHKYQRVKEMMQDGFIDKPTAQRLLDFPDIEAEENLAMAAQDDVDATLAKILDLATPVYTPPDEFTDLELLVSRTTAAYLRAKHQDGIEPERLEMLIQLIDQANALLNPPQAVPPMPMPPPGPEGMGEMPSPGGMPIPGGMPMPAGMAPPMPDVNINNQMPVPPAVPPIVGG